ESDTDIDGDKTIGQFGNSDGWVVRLDAYGVKVGDYALGGTDYDYLWSADTAGPDSYFLAGGSFSNPSGNKSAPNQGDEDIWVINMLERTAPVGTPVVMINGRFNPAASVTFATSAVVELQTTFTNGFIFYSLDGSNPGDGFFYTGPFVLQAGATLRAVAFNSNFTAGAEAEAIAVNVQTPPAITLQPQGGLVVLGENFTLTGAATGTALLHYQWLLNGTNVPGANAPQLQIPSVLPANAGAYRFVVTNAFGAATSALTQVSVLLPPGISTHPHDTNVFPGAAVTFCVAASGSPPFRYQWRRNGVNIPGVTNSCFTIDPVTVTDSGTYTVVVANDAGVDSSQPARLVVNVVPTPPGDNFVDHVPISGTNGFVVGTNTFATREAGEPLHAGKPGSNSVWYTWQAPATGIATFRTTGSGFDTLLAIYTGTVVSNLTTVGSDEDRGDFLTSLVRFNAGAGTNYQIAIDGLAGAVGDIVLLWELEVTAATLPAITNQPVSQTVIAGANATFSVGASGAGLTYQWNFFTNVLAGRTNATLTLSNVQRADVGAYTVTVGNNAGRSVTSSPAILEIGSLPNVQSVDKFEDLFGGGGGGGAFASAIKGKANTTAVSDTSIPVSAGTVASQVLNNTGSQTEPREPNACGVIGASSRWLSLTPASSGILVIDSMGSAIDTVLAVYTNDVNNLLAPLQFVACDNNSAPDGLRSLLRFQAVGGKEYFAAVDGVNGEQGSVQMQWRLGFVPAVQSPSAGSLTYRLGDNVTLSIASSNGVPPPDFQWRRNDLGIAGATNAILDLGAIQAGQAGTYSVVVSNYAGAVTSLVAQITVEVPLHVHVALERVGNLLRVHINGTASQGVVLQTTSDLVNWLPVQIFPTANASFEFTDDRAGEPPLRFYRVVPWP
ncbi:MAG TPA: immunoglobulin domain-containing protein, partial [Verrucomicrobiae bacterium]